MTRLEGFAINTPKALGGYDSRMKSERDDPPAEPRPLPESPHLFGVLKVATLAAAPLAMALGWMFLRGYYGCFGLAVPADAMSVTSLALHSTPMLAVLTGVILRQLVSHVPTPSSSMLKRILGAYALFVVMSILPYAVILPPLLELMLRLIAMLLVLSSLAAGVAVMLLWAPPAWLLHKILVAMLPLLFLLCSAQPVGFAWARWRVHEDATWEVHFSDRALETTVRCALPNSARPKYFYVGHFAGLVYLAREGEGSRHAVVRAFRDVEVVLLDRAP